MGRLTSSGANGRRSGDDPNGNVDEEDEWESEGNSEARAWSLSDGPFKLVLIVNMQLKMGKGKVRGAVTVP